MSLIKRILEIAKNSEEKHFAVYLLWEPSIRLYEAKRYNFAAKLLSCARKLDPSDEKLKELYQNSKQNAEILKSVNTVLEKPSVHDFVKHLVSIFVGRYFNEITDHDWSVKMEEVREVLVAVMTEDPDCSEIKQSLRYVRGYHKRLFEINSNFFGQLIDAPEASRITYQCPKCNNSAIFGIGSYGQYTCPKCNATLLYDDNGVTEQKGFIDAVKDLFSDW